MQFGLQQVIPTPWRISLPETEANRTISWKGGEPWPKTVEKIAEETGLRVVWGQGIVVLQSVNAAVPPAAPIASAAASTAAAADAPTHTPAPAPAPAAAAPPGAAQPLVASANPSNLSQPTLGRDTSVQIAQGSPWTVEPGSFRETMRGWAKRAGWNVLFLGDIDYEIESSAVFNGGFIEAASALVRAFRGTERPSTITFYPDNRTAVINASRANGD
jgi:hypothetical protein